MAPSPPGPVPAPPARRPSRLLLWLFLAGIALLLVLVVVPVLVVFGVHWYNRHQANRALEQVVAEVNGSDPEWQLDQIEKRRLKLPVEQNGALPVQAAAALMPSKGLANEQLKDIDEVLPQSQLDPATVKLLRKTLQPMLPAAALARKASAFKTGANHVTWSADYLGTKADYIMKVRDLGKLLQYLVMLQTQDGQSEEAWVNSLTILAAGRAFGEEPGALSQLVRKAFRTITVASLERCAAQGKVSDAQLAEAQRCLAEEAAQPILYYSMRGERAGMHCLFVHLEAGGVPDPSLPNSKSSLPGRVGFWFRGNTFKHEHTFVLKYLNDAVAASKLPLGEQLQKFKELQDRKNQAPPLAKALIAGYPKLAEASVRTTVQLQCAVAGLGVERFRLQFGRWPGSLDEVVSAKYLDQVPTDAYNGKPIRYRKTADGAVVYSVGAGGGYAGDALDAGRDLDPASVRCELRLWNEDRRRQPPRPKRNLGN